MEHLLRGVDVLPGRGGAVLGDAVVVLDERGVVVEIRPGKVPGRQVLMLAPVDLHLDVLAHYRRPRATVELDLTSVVARLDGELAAAGGGTVCIAARFDDNPQTRLRISDALELCWTVEQLWPQLTCDWRIHARAEVTQEGVVEAVQHALAVTSHVALISLMDSSIERTRFASADAHRRFYTVDSRLTTAELEAVIERRRRGAERAPERRRALAKLAARHGVPLASHDDRTPEQILEAFDLGARIAEFPLTLEAARTAHDLGMSTVLGAPNAIRGRSTSPGNLTVAEAVSAGLCDVLCSDYLTGGLLQAPFALASRGIAPLSAGAEMVSQAAAQALGVLPSTIAEGCPLDAVLVDRVGDVPIAIGLWRGGRLLYGRASLLDGALAGSSHRHPAGKLA